MANTFKFGNGNWATKEDSVLAYNDENNNFKPLPFDFTRASTATYVDSDGLIKTAGNGEARIDYTDSTDGALLLEPQRTNLLQYSEDFSNWTNANSTDSSNQIISPDGTQNADKVITNNGSVNGQVKRNVSKSASSITYTYSIFAKKGEWNESRLYITDNSSFVNRVQFFVSLENGEIIQATTSGTFSSASGSSQYYGNGWYRLFVTFTTGTETSLSARIYSMSSTATTGDGTSGIYIYGAQLEEGSYPTSYIPTSGSAVTRVADVCEGAGNSDVFNDSEGVLYAEIAALDEAQVVTAISISDSSISDRVLIALVAGEMRGQFVSTGNNIAKDTTGVVIENFNKIACSYTATTFKVFVNGLQIGTTGAVTASMSGVREIAFDRGDSQIDFQGKVKEVRVYNTALSDSELATLTT